MLRVVSGGQTGVDAAALFAALECGLPTGGWMPKGWRTLEGPHPEYQEIFGMQESPDYSYSKRTVRNILDSDLTLVIAKDFTSSGTLLTVQTLLNLQKPHSKLDWITGVRAVGKAGIVPSVEFAAKAIKEHIAHLRGVREYETAGDVVLNVAGNSERSAQGIYSVAFEYLCKLFPLIGDVSA